MTNGDNDTDDGFETRQYIYQKPINFEQAVHKALMAMVLSRGSPDPDKTEFKARVGAFAFFMQNYPPKSKGANALKDLYVAYRKSDWAEDLVRQLERYREDNEFDATRPIPGKDRLIMKYDCLANKMIELWVNSPMGMRGKSITGGSFNKDQ